MALDLKKLEKAVSLADATQADISQAHAVAEDIGAGTVKAVIASPRGRLRAMFRLPAEIPLAEKVNGGKLALVLNNGQDFGGLVALHEYDGMI